ncbi:MAG TPA: type III PLP-dependent enzyme [Chloroflexota bacterium]|nr:type III PLP-dependent enzyme [Chloroflexota bacterium]
MNRVTLEHREAPAVAPAAARLIERSHALATPFLLIDPTRLRENLRQLRAAFPRAGIYYAVKANPHPRALQIVAEEGGGFEISSDGELDLVEAVGRGAPLLSSNPIKAPSFIRRAARAGVTAFAVDSADELVKVAREAPAASVYVRLLVDNSGSEWPLARKYGVDRDEAVALLAQAADLGLDPCGTTFHVGSQCRLAASWDAALAVSADVWNGAAQPNLDLTFLSIGGGFPVQHTRPIPSFGEIGEAVQRAIADRFPPAVNVTLEPGRAIVGDAALLGASVIGKARRGDERWVYLDVGVFNGLMETIAGFSYEVSTLAGGPRSDVVLAGPSCDSVDVIADSALLPELNVGDRVYFLNAGAYTLAYASHFNGWPPPVVHFLE